jgi:hypothetical protein
MFGAQKSFIASEIFLRRDIGAMLAALDVTLRSVPDSVQSPHAAAYRRGFRAALGAVATALHIPVELVLPSAPSAPVVRVFTVDPAGYLTTGEGGDQWT